MDFYNQEVEASLRIHFSQPCHLLAVGIIKFSVCDQGLFSLLIPPAPATLEKPGI